MEISVRCGGGTSVSCEVREHGRGAWARTCRPLHRLLPLAHLQAANRGGTRHRWSGYCLGMAQRAGFTLRVHMDSDLQRREKTVARPGCAQVRESQLRKHVRDSRPVLSLIVIALTMTLTQTNV